MMTTHNFYFGDSNNMHHVSDKSVHLVVTSPPYPMIEMWDELFSDLDYPAIESVLKNQDGIKAFELMHRVLNEIWEELDRVVVDGGIICINIGDATRKIGDIFELYPNHIKIVDFFINKGYSTLPCIIWRKQSNKPNKFMGSGMLPVNAYVTMEHEYILIFRKGNNRKFSDPVLRKNSAFFWEERNLWFSDIWTNLKGVPQSLTGSGRSRSAAFPFELAYRLINMFSIMNDTILDPFAGLGTTALAALCSKRNSINYELDSSLWHVISDRIINAKDFQHNLIDNRLNDHINFVNSRETKYISTCYGFPVVTSQEIDIHFYKIDNIEHCSNYTINATYL